jgi:hypothetical protein
MQGLVIIRLLNLQRMKWVVFFCLLGFLFPSSSDSVNLSFDQVLEMMYTTNESIRAGRMEENQRQHERSAMRGLYFLQISTNGRYTRIDDPIRIDLDPIRSYIGMTIPSLRIPCEGSDEKNH